MEIIIVVAVLVGVAVFWVNHVKTQKSKTDNAIDTWTPAKTEDKPWPYGEKVAEGKVHVKSADVAPGKSEADRVEAPAPTVAEVTAENKAEAVAKAKKAPAKKQQFDKKPAAEKKPAAAKKAPAKKKSV